MTKVYLWMKVAFACATVLIAELAYVGSGPVSVDWRSLAINVSLAWGVLQMVEFFLLRDAIENTIAKGVVDWVKTNIHVAGAVEEAKLTQASTEFREAS